MLYQHIDLNADVGEYPAALADGSEHSLLRLITSANIACGGHAGDDESMRSVIMLCTSAGVAVGAHPGFPDRHGFGRELISIPSDELEASLRLQIRSLARIASALGAIVRHVKPHGALYNAAAKDSVVAGIVAHAVAAVDNTLILVGLAGTPMLDVWRAAGFNVVGEAFADRRYEPDGSLRSRKYPDAVIDDPGEAGRQALEIVCDGVVRAVDGSRLRIEAQTLCIHGDTKNASIITAAVRRGLESAGIRICSFSSPLR